jgi:hypothetical protein
MTDAFFELSWRVWPAMTISAAGALLFFRGVTHQVEARRAGRTVMAKPIGLAAGLRLLLLGGSLVALGLAWIFQIVWLFWIAAIIGAEETLETSIVVSALREGERVKAERARRAGKTP